MAHEPRPIPPPVPIPPRRTDLPLPPYRFVAGLHPHPLSDEGHGAPVPEDPALAFAYACDLFDHRYWWEAHEAWEGLWRDAQPGSPDAELLQGLIQGAAGLFKRWTGHPGGAATLIDRACRRLRAVPPGWDRGLDLPELADRLEAALAGGPLPVLPTSRPRPP